MFYSRKTCSVSVWVSLTDTTPSRRPKGSSRRKLSQPREKKQNKTQNLINNDIGRPQRNSWASFQSLVFVFYFCCYKSLQTQWLKNNTKLFTYRSGGQKSDTGLTRAKSKHQQGGVPFWKLEGTLFSGLSQLLEADCIPWLRALFLHLQSQHILHPPDLAFLVPARSECWEWFSAFKDSCD